MKLAIIPARSGSKRVAQKNTREFCGQPIIAYSIQAALACPAIDRVWVTTEDEHIAQIARHYGAEVPFTRPASLADDFTVLKDIMEHALGFASDNAIAVDYACLLFATAPIMSPFDIARGYDTLQASDADMALSVTQFRSAPQRAQYIDEQGFLRYDNPKNCSVRTQDLKPMFHDAAQFVWARPDAFSRAATDLNITPVPISPERVVDIDTPEDWAYAEFLYQAYLAQSFDKAA